MSKQLRLGLLSIGDGRALEAALSAANVAVAGFGGENTAAMAELADVYGALAVADWRHLLSSDALYVGADVAAPGSLLPALAVVGKPLLLSTALLAAPGASEWLAPLTAGAAPVGVARLAPPDAGLAYSRSLVQAGVLGPLLSVQVRVSEAATAAAWAALADELGTALWASDLTLASASWLGAAEGEALWLSALLQTAQGVPVAATLLGAAPGGAHDDLLAPRLLGTRGQLILAHEPLGWFTAATESNTSQRWEKLIYAGSAGSLSRSIEAFAAALLAGEALPSPLAAELPLARLLAAMQAAPTGGAWAG